MTSSPTTQTRIMQQQHQLSFRRSMSPTGSSCSEDDDQRNLSKFGLSLNSMNQADLQQAVAAQQAAAAAAAAQLVRKLQQQQQLQQSQSASNSNAILGNNNNNINNISNNHNNSGNNNSNNNSGALTNGNGFTNYSAFYNAAAAAIGGADLPLLSGLNGLTANGNNSLNSNNNNGNGSTSSTASGLGSQSNLNKNGASHSNGSNGLNTSGSSSATSPYVATNECRIIEYRGARIAAFLTSNKTPAEYLLCLPQAFELFLKHLVGGLHTVYTKLKRLDIVPIVCNVEQVRILRGLGAIQPGVNRCKLLATKDFDVLYKDCTTASRFPSSSNSPGLSNMQAFNGLAGALPGNGSLGTGPLLGASVNGNTNSNALAGADFNTAACLWLLSQQQQQQAAAATAASQSPISGSNASGTGNGSSTGNTANALSALNLTRTLGNLTSSLNVSGNNGNANESRKHGLDDSTDEEDDDDDDDDEDADIRSTHSSNASESNVFNGMKTDHSVSQLNSNGHNKENKDKECNGSLPFGQLSNSHVGSIVSIGSPALPTSAGSGGLLLGNSLASIGNNIANSDCLESLLRNIEGLVAIAVHNARQQQNQLNMHKAELRAEMLSQTEKERDFREQLERQLNEEQRIRLLYQKRFRKERKFRRKIEQDLLQVQTIHQKLHSSQLATNQANQLPMSTSNTLPTLGQQAAFSSADSHQLQTSSATNTEMAVNDSSASSAVDRLDSPSSLASSPPPTSRTEDRECEMAVD